MHRRWLALPVLLLAGATLAQSPPANSASSARLTIRTRSDQKVFRIGEVIPLELAFTSMQPDYQLDMASYDRSGRMNEEQFAIQPATGWDDPLASYFHAYQGFIGGGIRGMKTLSTQATYINLELNEWVRFRIPGRYRVVVSSGRVSRMHGPFAHHGVVITSNAVDLTILAATKEWQDSTLKSALALLDSSKDRAPRTDGVDPKREAVKTLRYLGTPSAAAELARRMTGTDSDWDFSFGLIGSLAPDAALRQMQELITEPHFPVTAQFLGTMSVLAVAGNTSSDLPAKREIAERRFRDELISSIPGKEGAAQAVSIKTIIEDAAISSREFPTDLKKNLTRALVSTFDELPVQQQVELIESRWPALDHHEMLPVLRKLASRDISARRAQDMSTHWIDLTTGDALKHWYEVAPEEARPHIIEEILRPQPRFGADVLGVLPDKELPEVEQPLVQHLAMDPDFDIAARIATLIHRYATGAVEGGVIGYLDPSLGKMACAIQEPLLAYLLKVDPESARSRLLAAMTAAGEGYSACNHSLLTDVSRLQNHAILEDIAIEFVDSPDPQVVASAAGYLGQFGHANAEQILWAKFTSWSEHWKGRENELDYDGAHPERLYEANAGSTLLQALATAHGWLTDEAKLRRLIDLSVGTSQQQTARSYLSQWQSRPRLIVFAPFEPPQIQIAQYQEASLQAAKEKLDQFPKSTVFQWSSSGGQVERKAFDELSGFAREKGFTVLPPRDWQN